MVERVGIYARVSTAGREQLKSLAAQISGLTRYASEQENIPSPKGSNSWPKKTISLILTNAKYTGNTQIMKSDLSQGSYCLSDSHEAIISKDDFAQVQKEIERRAKKKRQFESAASSLVRTINWAEPISSSSSQDLERVRTINWPDPEELENEK